MLIPEDVVPAPNFPVTTLPQFTSVGQHLHTPHIMQLSRVNVHAAYKTTLASNVLLDEGVSASR